MSTRSTRAKRQITVAELIAREEKAHETAMAELHALADQICGPRPTDTNTAVGLLVESQGIYGSVVRSTGIVPGAVIA